MKIDAQQGAPALQPTRPQDPEREVREVAKDFEGLMLNELLKSMRRTIPNEQESSFGMGTFNSMLDEQLAQGIAASGGLGLADALAKELHFAPQVPENSVDGPEKTGGRR